MSEKIIGIYVITNKSNGDCYVGKSLNVEGRWKAHLRTCKNKKSKAYDYYLYRAMRFYGVENFKFEILEVCETSDLNFKEKYYYDLYSPVYCMIDPLENPTQSFKLDKDIFKEKCRKGWVNRSAESKNITLENLKDGSTSKGSNKFESKKIVSIKLLSKEERFFNSLLEAERILGIPRSSISQILNKNHSRKSSKGYTFRFI